MRRWGWVVLRDEARLGGKLMSLRQRARRGYGRSKFVGDFIIRALIAWHACPFIREHEWGSRYLMSRRFESESGMWVKWDGRSVLAWRTAKLFCVKVFSRLWSELCKKRGPSSPSVMILAAHRWTQRGNKPSEEMIKALRRVWRPDTFRLTFSRKSPTIVLFTSNCHYQQSSHWRSHVDNFYSSCSKWRQHGGCETALVLIRSSSL